MTYSIVARDPHTGALGVACQSHFFAVGAAVNHARAGIGVVATQSFVEPAYGVRGLDLMAAGAAPDEALERVRETDPLARLRQVAMIDSQGRAAVHTGRCCVPEHGNRAGNNYLVQGNMLASPLVLDAMAEAMNRDAPLAERLLDALRAAEAAGGDLRGSQAAGMRIVSGKSETALGTGTLLDLRVDDAADPVAELARLVRQHELATALAGVLFAEGLVIGGTPEPDPDALDHALDRLAELAGHDGEVALDARLWRTILLDRAGRAEEAHEAARAVTAGRPALKQFLVNLDAAGFLPARREPR